MFHGLYVFFPVEICSILEKNQERPWEDYFNEWFIPVFIVIAFSALSIRKCFDILMSKK